MFKKILKSVILGACIIGILFTAKSDVFAVTKKKADKIEISKKTVSMKVDESIFIGYDKKSDVKVKVVTSKKSKAFDVSIKNNENIKFESEKGKIKITALKSGTVVVKIMLKNNPKVSKKLKLRILEKGKGAANNIIEVTAETFDKEVLQAKGKVIVEYYANWCGQCRKLNPIYKEAAKVRPIYKFTQVDVDKDEEFVINQDIFTVPTLHLYEDGKLVKIGGYSSAKTLDKFIEWIEN